MESLRKHKLTLGLVLALLSGAGIVWTLAFRAQASAQETADKSVLRHEQRDIEQAHPASKRMLDRLERIERQIGEVAGGVKRIEGKLSR